MSSTDDGYTGISLEYDEVKQMYRKLDYDEVEHCGKDNGKCGSTFTVGVGESESSWHYEAHVMQCAECTRKEKQKTSKP
jgi:hypothetical protein